MELHPLEVASFRLEQGFGLKSALNTRPFNLEISKLVKKCLQFSFNDPWFYFCQQHTLTGFIPQSRCSKWKHGKIANEDFWSPPRPPPPPYRIDFAKNRDKIRIYSEWPNSARNRKKKFCPLVTPPKKNFF